MKNNNSLNYSSNENEDLDIQKIIDFYIRNKFNITASVIIFFLISIVFSLFQPKVWKGEFEIVLDKVENKLKKDIKLISPLLSDKIGDESNLNTQVGILESSSVLMPIFEYVKNEKFKKDINYDYTFTDWKETYLDISLKEKTSILQISYKDEIKEIIIPVLNKMTKEYQKYSGKNKNRNTQLAKKYLQEQIDLYKIKSLNSLKEAQEFAIEQDLETYEIGMGGSILNSARSSDNNTQNSIQTNSFLIPNTGIEGLRVSASTRIRNINIILEKIKNPDIEFSIVDLSYSIPSLSKDSDLIEKLDSLDNLIVDLQNKYTDKDPTLSRVIKKRDLLAKLIEGKAIDYLKAEIVAQKSILEASKKPKEVLIKYKELIRLASRDEFTLINLENEFRKINLEEARIEDPWELISKPTLQLKPVSPKKSIYGLFGIISGLLLSSTIIFSKEKYYGIIYDIDYLESSLKTKVLEKIDLKNENFKNYSKEILINEILDFNSVKKYDVIKLGKITKNEVDDFINLLSNKNGLTLSIQNSLIKDEIDPPLIILTKLGSFTTKELNSLKNRIKLTKKVIKGIILI